MLGEIVVHFSLISPCHRKLIISEAPQEIRLPVAEGYHKRG
jgi:hypothetical protein